MNLSLSVARPSRPWSREKLGNNSDGTGFAQRVEREDLKLYMLGGKLLDREVIVRIRAVAAPACRRCFRLRPPSAGSIQVSLNREGRDIMTRRFLTFKKALALMSFVVVFGVRPVVLDATIMNGKEVTPYIGQIVSHNERTGQIVIKMDKSTGHWRLSKHTVVLSGKERLTLSDIWGKTQKVQVYVSKDGEVQRISVLEWK
jgi:hypothetical protein